MNATGTCKTCVGSENCSRRGGSKGYLSLKGVGGLFSIILLCQKIKKKILYQRERVVPENVKNNAICMNLDTHSAFHQLLPIYSLGQFIF